MSSLACSTACSTSAGSDRGASPAARSTERRVRVWEREETKPARWAASWTESTKTSDFFSASSRVAWPNMLDSVTDIRVAMALPVKRMASVWPQLGQVSLAESSSASSRRG
ncbi:hypothetical protein G7085_20380 [Tessaracoccus sp. HDW20]|nr:hypothetical protein [Tessaracoccus coleopterorum]NHB86085.1 hypothetical protein [Tessaracoccus coleopterorum]